MPSASRFTLLAGAVAVAALSGCSAKDNGSNADLIAGKKLFVQKCGACHVLGHAGTKGVTGPNLDDAFADPVHQGFGTSAIRGMVRQQIQLARHGGIMPANLVTGQDAQNVAAYVASVVSRGGQDQGLLASAVPSTSSKPALAKNGTLTIPADPNGQLQYTAATATARAGKLTLDMPNTSGTPHNIAIDGKGAGKIVPKGTSTFSATFAPGTYTYYCQVPGHREAGMQGKLTVR